MVFYPADLNFAQKLIPGKKARAELNFKIILPALQEEEFEEYHPSSVLLFVLYNVLLLEQGDFLCNVQGREGWAVLDLQEQGEPRGGRQR